MVRMIPGELLSALRSASPLFAQVLVPVGLWSEAGGDGPALIGPLVRRHFQDHPAVESGGAPGVVQQEEPFPEERPKSRAEEEDRQS
ncbi:hypothetical protein [Streptomyces sp. SLBN-118]|uniref:hypothetical protein n=1 Tax=Streptomyces sp. SLBN-118 TaxID=2768454 RepID=UPI0037D99C38